MDLLKQKINNLSEQRPKKMPIKGGPYIDVSRAAILRECLYFRLIELTESIFEECKNDRLISAITLQRAYMETEALFNLFTSKLEKALNSANLNSDNFEKFKTFLMNALRGSRFEIAIEEYNRPESINILKCIDALNKKIPNYRTHYEFLCEFTHPNSAGVNHSYVSYDWKKWVANFSPRRDKINSEFILNQLDLSIDFFIKNYNQSAGLLDKFCELVLKQLKKENPK